MKKTIKLWFIDFYKGFDPYDNYLINFLKPEFQLEVSPKNPDFIIYSCHGKEFLNFNCTRIFYTGENLVPDFNLCDFAIGFHHLQFNDRYLRFPNYAFLRDQFEQLVQFKTFTSEDLHKKTIFCNFIYANSEAHPARDEFFHALNKYKKVSSPGKHLNNINFDIGKRFADDWMYTKLNFQSSCKFSIAFENTSTPGYVTEKIMHAFITNTIPVYWGDPEVARDFNPKAFINCHDFGTFEEVVAYIEKIDDNQKLFLDILNEPAFRDNKVPEHLQLKKLMEFFNNIFSKNEQLRIKRPLHGACKNYEEGLKSSLNKKRILGKLKSKFKL
ncbi:hypothetical protein LB467_05310 [Salegentibacter sp. JZCK2]|uniref:glycosyltransferase family 10 domain-containing protein n=1 Tax=Salegentibacter tibetensis TaxID=2873600 RepID=UPI001CCF1403|nr:glycosyltransferase family 10 [Salegentibacter tibetensis]MBZ9729096.1 hypothetical protein [Salegentibacter tibetensis]